MDAALDFNETLFDNINEYNKLIISLFESLKNVTPSTFWNMDHSSKSGLSTIIALEIIDLILNSYDKIADNFYSNNLTTHEFPFFIETKEMVECLLLDPFYESEEFLTLAINLSAEFFTLIEVKLLLFEGYGIELEAPQEVLDEYDKEFENYLKRFNDYKEQFMILHN